MKTIFRVDDLRIHVMRDDAQNKYLMAVEDGQREIEQVAQIILNSLSLVNADIDLSDTLSKFITMNEFNGAYADGHFISVSNGALFLIMTLSRLSEGTNPTK